MKKLGQVVLRYRVTTAETNITRRATAPRRSVGCFLVWILRQTFKKVPVFYLKKWWGKGRNINFSCFYIGFAGRVRLDSVVFDSVKTTAINTIIIMFCCNLCKINCASENIKYESWVFCVNSKIINSSRIVCKVWNFISDIIYTLGLTLVWNDNPLHFFHILYFGLAARDLGNKWKQKYL